MNGRIGVDAGENKGQNAHHQERIGDRPGDSQRHIPVANPEVLEHQILQQEDKIAVLHAMRLPHRDREFYLQLCRVSTRGGDCSFTSKPVVRATRIDRQLSAVSRGCASPG